MSQNGIRKIDYMLVTHFEGDHMGAVGRMAANVPIANYVDHGENVTYGKDDDWWRQRRESWMRWNGLGRHSDQLFDEYKQARDKGHYIPVTAGDHLPVKGLDVTIVSAAGNVITKPLVRGAAAPATCSAVDRRAQDDAEDGQSVGDAAAVMGILFCPVNMIGAVDAYMVTHHGQSMTDKLGLYYFGLSCCSAAEVNGLHPRVAILSMGAQGHKEAAPAAIQLLREMPARMPAWQP